MSSKAFTGLIVAFWVVMMAALVRVELFPSPTKLTAIPLNQVLRKIFENNEPQSLRVLYQGKEIGLSTLEITALPFRVAKTGESLAGQPGGYQVKAGMSLDLNVFGTPSRFHLSTDSRFDAHYEIKDYRVRTMVGASQVEINGQNAARKITMTYDIGDGPQQRQLDYDQLTGPGAWEALGLPGLSGLASVALPVGASGSAGNLAALQPVIHAYEDHLTISDIRQHAYLVDCRSDANPAYWVKIWVDDQGTILIVETSLGMMMRASSIDSLADRTAGTTVLSRTRPLQ